MPQTKIFRSALSDTTKTGGVALPCLLTGCVTSSHVLVVAFPEKFQVAAAQKEGLVFQVLQC